MVNRNIILILWLIFTCSRAFGQQDSVDNGITISLITGSPGNELYSTFGHSAIRVQNVMTGEDILYNYGTFDFDTPNFYIKFIRAKLLYMLSIDRTVDLARYYQRENRSITEQVFNLNNEQEMRLINFLIWNYLPENRGYKYDFFYNNCATVIRDIFENRYGVEYNIKENQNVTFRELLDEYLYKSPWSDFGIDLILGLPADKKADFRNQMFLPDYLSSNLAQAMLDGKPLLQPAQVLQSRTELASNNGLIKFTPMLVFVIVALMAIIITLSKNQKIKDIFDIFLFSACGLAGLFFLFMWFGTDHIATKNNWNVLWLNPLYIISVVAIIRKSNKKWLRISFAIYATILWLLLLTWGWFPQQFNMAVIPILIILIVRSMDREGVILDLIKKAASYKQQVSRQTKTN
ncbi:MAG: DUF4105 domain-containing protein [Saprospiraceae bacterium]|nr:DUF4105 domain-containing protein [Saprospiraceae bacterium]